MHVSKSPSPLSAHTGYWLRQLSNAVSSAFAERLAAHEVSVPQWVVLRVLFDHEALPLKDIVREVEVDQGSLSRMVDRLLARGWVQRETDGHDRRAVAISLTPAGRRLVPRLAAEADANDHAFFSVLPPARHKELLGLIKELLKRNQTGLRSPIE